MSGISLGEGYTGVYAYDAGGSAACGAGFFAGSINGINEVFKIDSNNFVVNENSEDIDFRVETNAYNDFFKVDAGDNYIKMGTLSKQFASSAPQVEIGTGGAGGGGLGIVSGNSSSANRYALGIWVNQGSAASSTDRYATVFYEGSTGVQRGSITVNNAGTTYNTTSDARLKDNIETITDGTDKLMAMNPVTHKWIADPEAPAVHGFIAQEMQDIVPEAVSGDPEGEEMMSMDYGRITPVLVAALQDAHKKIEALEARINEMEAK